MIDHRLHELLIKNQSQILRLAKVAVYNAIDRLVEAKRIRICSEGRRQGQTHYLGINCTSNFDELLR